jgi:thiol:disulfide interchange protein DsbD
MIPITVGMLQAQGSSSWIRNVLLSLSYTCGIATTFAVLGLISAFTGQLFGSMMQSPFVLIPLIIFLLYLAGSMIGLYEMYTPRFMKQQNTKRDGSLLTAFTFGVASGTIASPCVSPGLLLLLTIVSSMQNLFAGFALLFMFGVGISMPLLIIGIFSGSLSVMPKAGMWMVIIKNGIGILLIFACAYLSQPFIAWQWSTLIAISLSMLAISIQRIKKHSIKSAKYCVKIILFDVVFMFLISTTLWYFVVYKQIDNQQQTQLIAWQTNYNYARTIAQQQDKPLFIDFGAPYCSVCKAIDKKFFANQDVADVVNNNFVPVKIDITDEQNEFLQYKFNIIGVPVINIVNAHTEKERQRWGGQVYNWSIKNFIKKLSK